MIPDIRYVTTDGVSIAYQVIGNGPIDIVFVPGWMCNIEVIWEQPQVARFLQRLAAFSRLILFDKRGTGLSDRITEAATLEERMDDVRAVMHAVGSTRAALFGYSEGGAMCALFAATYPDRAAAVITVGGFPRRVRGADYPWAPEKEDLIKTIEAMAPVWGGPVGMEPRMASVAKDPICRQWWAKFLRQSGSVSSALALSKANADIDIRHILSSIRVPTLIIQATHDPLIPVEVGRYMADKIPNAQFALIDTIDHVPYFEAADQVLQATETFLLGVPTESVVETVISTLMFTDIVGSTAMAIEKGDQRYADLLDAHNKTVRRELSLHRGQEIETAGDGFLVAFDGPARAIKCGVAITKSLKAIGIPTRVGLHTGECEMRDGRVRGIALNIAARVMALAPDNSVMVSQTVRDLVAGSGLRFVDAGQHTLKGLPDQWRLFQVEGAA